MYSFKECFLIGLISGLIIGIIAIVFGCNIGSRIIFNEIASCQANNFDYNKCAELYDWKLGE